jgi:GMP synthase (glutamine-hydrolysing)
MLVSGGVDSTVAFTLLNKVLGADRVQGLLVDTGLMRKNEVAMIRSAFDELKITNLRIEDASEEFFKALEGVTEPERKRRIIGDTFLAVQKRVSEEMGLGHEKGVMLGQGTIYPDTIETGGTTHADTIKTHHNRVPAIQAMIEKGLVIEPLADLYKDEVRALGEELGLPHALVWRHPFPGPGLGVRILCADMPEIVEADTSAIAPTHAILPVRSVGVQGDGRTYRHAIALFSEPPCEPPTEHWSLATAIPNAHKTFNRVLQCLSHASPPDFIFSRGGITRQRADLLREADHIVDATMREAGWYEKIWQFPVVLLPFGTRPHGQSIVLRPISSTEAMTANAIPLPGHLLEKMTARLLELGGVDAVFLDMTDKPPATIEWE